MSNTSTIPQAQYIKLPDGSYGSFPSSMKDEEITAAIQKNFPQQSPAAVRASTPTQFENERNPANQESFGQHAWSVLKDQASGLASKAMEPWTQGKQFYDASRAGGHGVASSLASGAVGAVGASEGVTPQSLASTANTIPDYNQRRSEGYNPLYSAVAPLAAQATGVNLPSMEHQADIGNKRGVLAEAAVPAAETVGLYGSKVHGGKIADAIPNAERAGRAFQEVKGAAGNVPIDMAKPGSTALEIYEQSQHGASLPMAVRKFIMRATDPKGAPMTYAEAKDFQSNISQLSADEKMSMKPNTVRLLGQLNQDLKESLAGAADTVGKGGQFKGAMEEYRGAKKWENIKENAAGAAKKTAIGTIPAAAGYYGMKKILDSKHP